MRTKFISSIKSVFVFCFILFSVIACEKDFEDVGVSLVDNDLFNTSKMDFEVIAYSKDVTNSRVGNLPQYPLGVYSDPNFGLIKASFIGQLGLPNFTDFGTDAKIDSVILDIPYYATDTSSAGNAPNFKLDSILANDNGKFQLSVYESGTFLNTLEPTDLTKSKEYYSNEDYTKKTLLYSGLFEPSRNDTVLYIKRDFLFPDIDTLVIDTIVKDPLKPSIKLPLDEVFFKNNFIDQQNSAALSSLDNFINYFRGIIIEGDGTEGSLMTLAMSDATINIYYTNTVDSEFQRQSMAFPLSGIRTAAYVRDYTMASGSDINNQFAAPNLTEGHEKLYVQGAAGSIAEIEVLIDLDEIRTKNWLVNGAILDLYVVDNENNRNIPEQLYLYKADDNSLITDVLTEARVNGIGGLLERDEVSGTPLRYRFTITDYISELLKSDSTGETSKLALKTYHPTDAPLSFADTIVKNFSWRPKGVVLKGNKLSTTNKEDKRLKLTIYYTEDTN